ncbi:MAG: PLDc_N domain-containing protein [Anaerolineales bacterium]|nr:PLDc_N domain-containing protein [Anaerolineales bacterium]
METLQQYLPLIIPLVVIQLILMAAALLDLRRREKTRGPKWLWAVIIIFGEMVGPIVYFAAGRVEE